ncbi:MAG: molecular chaperone GrpE, partial [Patescibacteria group bacterium]|nr:molecular chaperone GrpE [Patescibacteria group bacterium]
KLKHCESEKRETLEEMQRTKADFLNARKRLEEERLRDRERSKMNQVEELIPLCDSFQMAMSDRELWEKADENWRKGIEGIYSQLEKLLTKYQVELINPLGEQFNPHQHEALSTTKVKEEKEHDKVISVIQNGYQITHLNGTTELIRPARVLIGVYEDK